MLRLISLIIPPLLAVYLRGKIIRGYGSKIRAVVCYILTSVTLNLVMFFILRYVFDSRGNLILKLGQYNHYAIKYFFLSVMLAMFELCAEWGVRKRHGQNVLWGGEWKKAFLAEGRSQSMLEQMQNTVRNVGEKLGLEIKCYKNGFRAEDWKIFKMVFIIAVLVHAFVLTNNLANYDSMWFFYNDQDVVISGRWFLKYAGGISSFFHLQWVNGVLSLIYISAAAVVVVKMLEIKSLFWGVLSGVALAVYPAVARTFDFMYAADAYFLAMLLATAAAWLMCMDKWSFRLFGGTLLGFSMGIYQAYISVTLVLFLLWVMKRALLRHESIVKNIGGMMVGLLSAACVYVVGLEYRLDGRELTSYQGISGSTLIHPLAWYFKRFFGSFKDIVHLYVSDVFENTYVLAAVVIIWSATILFALYRVVVLLRNRMVSCAILGGLAMLLIPIAVYCLRLLSGGVNYYGLMLESVAFVWVLPIMILDEGIRIKQRGRWSKAISAVVTVCYLANLWNYAIVDNISYLASSVAYEKSFALAERIVDRMEQTEGYEDMEYVYFYGNVETEKYDDARFHNKSVIGNKIIPYSNIPYTYFTNIYIGGSYRVLRDTGRMSEIQESLEFQNMPVWPAAGCTRMIGDVMVVKLRD